MSPLLPAERPRARAPPSAPQTASEDLAGVCGALLLVSNFAFGPPPPTAACSAAIAAPASDAHSARWRSRASNRAPNGAGDSGPAPREGDGNAGIRAPTGDCGPSSPPISPAGPVFPAPPSPTKQTISPRGEHVRERARCGSAGLLSPPPGRLPPSPNASCAPHRRCDSSQFPQFHFATMYSVGNHRSESRPAQLLPRELRGNVDAPPRASSVRMRAAALLRAAFSRGRGPKGKRKVASKLNNLVGAFRCPRTCGRRAN